VCECGDENQNLANLSIHKSRRENISSVSP